MEDKRDDGKDGRSHNEARENVCCSCGRKVKAQGSKKPTKRIDEKTANLVRAYVFEGYSVSNPGHPTALCTTCRLALNAFEKVYLDISHYGDIFILYI